MSRVSKPYCSKCGSQEGPFVIHGRHGEKTYHYCRSCNAENHRRYYHTEKGKQAILKANRVYSRKKRGVMLGPKPRD